MKKKITTPNISLSTTLSTTPIAVGVIFMKETPLGKLLYGSLQGKQHRKIPVEVIENSELGDGEFVPFLVFYNSPGRENLYIIVKGELKEKKFRWKRVNRTLIVVEKTTNLIIPPQYGGVVVGTSRELKEAQEGKFICLPHLTSSSEEKIE